MAAHLTSCPQSSLPYGQRPRRLSGDACALRLAAQRDDTSADRGPEGHRASRADHLDARQALCVLRARARTAADDRGVRLRWQWAVIARPRRSSGTRARARRAARRTPRAGARAAGPPSCSGPTRRARRRRSRTRRARAPRTRSRAACRARRPASTRSAGTKNEWMTSRETSWSTTGSPAGTHSSNALSRSSSVPSLPSAPGYTKCQSNWLATTRAVTGIAGRAPAYLSRATRPSGRTRGTRARTPAPRSTRVRSRRSPCERFARPPRAPRPTAHARRRNTSTSTAPAIHVMSSNSASIRGPNVGHPPVRVLLRA